MDSDCDGQVWPCDSSSNQTNNTLMIPERVTEDAGNDPTVLGVSGHCDPDVLTQGFDQ